MVKMFFITLSVLILSAFVVTPVVSAQVDIFRDVCSGLDANGETRSAELDDPTICSDVEAADGATGDANPIYGNNGLLTRAISILSFVVGVAAVVVMVIAGIQMMLSQGEPAKVTKNRNQIIYAVVGLVVAVLAQAIVQFILNNL